MNKVTVAVRKLRQNFIKRNQINPDFFVFTEEQTASTPAANRNAFPIKNKIHEQNTRRSLSHTRHRSLASLQRPFQNYQKIVSNPQSTVISIKGKAIFTQDKLSHKLQSRRNAVNRIELLQDGRSSVLLSHCSVQAIKIENRPRSAFSSVKTVTNKVLRISSSKKENKLRKKSEHLKPWEVEEEQIYTCWI